MEVHVQKWNDSLALCIPNAFAAEIGWEQNSLVEISLVDKRLIVASAIEPTLTLESLLAQVTEHNLHSQVETGPAMGNEAW